jgi:hypothetical protein
MTSIWYELLKIKLCFTINIKDNFMQSASFLTSKF